ncbi:MAG: ferritin-like domain-containing protein [Actinomycetota bacterium]|nr:ferritin-like domain-containing protein [Actinomycetota bacterium]
MTNTNPRSTRDGSDDERSPELSVDDGGADHTGTAASSRAAFLRRAGVLGGTALATGGLVTALPKLANSAASTARDVRILNYVLRLEYLKAAFYREAAEGGRLTGELQQFAQLLARHERTHVALLRRQLGGRAEDERTFDFGDATANDDAFAGSARTLEELAVAAYIGQGANLTRRLMVPFAQLCSVEARHAAWIEDILDRDPAPFAADKAKTPAEVLAAIDRTGFEATS